LDATHHHQQILKLQTQYKRIIFSKEKTANMQFRSVVASALLAVVPATALVHPPSGNAHITVTIQGQSASAGCLDVNGLWVNNGNCAVYGGDGTGNVAGPNGACEIDDHGLLHCISVGEPTAFIGTYATSTSVS
jgi:hypothetical protein